MGGSGWLRRARGEGLVVIAVDVHEGREDLAVIAVLDGRVQL